MHSPLGWTGLSQWSYLAAAFAAMLLTVWMADRRRRGRESSRALIGALTLTTAWTLVTSSIGANAAVTQVLELMRALGHAEGAAFVIATHDGRLSSRCDRVLALLDGRLQ